MIAITLRKFYTKQNIALKKGQQDKNNVFLPPGVILTKLALTL